MKTAAKVFIWIGMIMQFIFIYPIIVGIFALKKIDEASSKNELQVFGVLTLFFCSFLGGIFMLSIKDEELSQSYENSILINAENQQEDLTIEHKERKGVKGYTIFGIILISVLLLTSLVFSILAASNYNGAAFVPLLINAVMLLLFIPIVILYFINKKKLSLTNLVLLVIFTLISINLIVMSIITNNHFAYSQYSYYDSYYRQWRFNTYYGDAWEYWVVFGIACAITVMAISLILTNLIGNANKKQKPRTQVVKTSRLEIELNEAKRLFENNVITEEEYSKIRTSVIEKYYK